jgi:N-acyl-D-amino-acid deacylase
MRWLAVLSAVLIGVSVVRADDPSRSAIEKGLRRIEQGAENYTKKRTCFSCHHTGMSLLSLSSARRRGFEVEQAKIKHQLDFTLKAFKSKKERILKGQGIEGGNTQAAYGLFVMEGAGHPADETTAALVEYLLQRQHKDGSWPALANRPPTEGSRFTNTALVLRALRHYGPAKDADKADELRERIDKAFAKGRDWLLKNKPETTEDKMFHLRGLVHGGADKKDIETARAALLNEQLKDGSWAQLPNTDGDAYATGGVVMALRRAGLKTTDAAYQNAVKYLLKTQQDDGAWIVQTRSKPVQVFFDNGDPGGKSQFISFAATNWAVLALLEQYPVR